MPPVTDFAARAFDETISGGGVAIFPTDTVYGLACDPANPVAVNRLYEMKGRPPAKPAAIMYFDLDRALGDIADFGPRTARALGALLPGAVTVIVPNPQRRYGLTAADRRDRIGVRVPDLGGDLAALRLCRQPVLQSSANLTGALDPVDIGEIAPEIVAAVDTVVDAGPLCGVSSTVVDLVGYEDCGAWTVLRSGAVPFGALARILDA